MTTQAQSLNTNSSTTGFIAAALIGAAATILAVSVQSVIITIIGGLNANIPVLWSAIIGATIGVAIAARRNDRDTSAMTVLTITIIATLIWLLIDRMSVLTTSSNNIFWRYISAFITLAGASFLTRYGLRDLSLNDVNRSITETLVLRMLRASGYVFFLSIVIFPFYFMVASSFKKRAELLQNPTDLSINFFQNWSDLFIGYREVLFTFDFLRYIGNSTFIAIATVLITLVLSVLGAYAVTRLNFPGREVLSRSILLIYMFPAIVLVIPLYAVFTQLGLRDTLPGLLIVYPATTIPVALYMLRSYFQTLPKDLEEAGMIDGCTRLGVIWRITLPLSVPALASVGLYVFMIAWNEFLFAFMFLDTPAIFTLSRGMVGLNSQEVPRQFLMAGAVIVTLPIMLIFFWFEKYLVGGLTAGGVKG